MTLQEIVAELARDPGYVTGKRTFRRTIEPDQVDAIVAGLQAEVDEGTRARGRAAEKQKLPVVCARGCSGCCEELVVVDQPESDRIARWLARPENAAVRDAFLVRYETWRVSVGDGPERLAELAAGDDAEAYRKAHVEAWRRRVMCAFNQNGECSIYPVRPIACRNAHAVETPDRCVGDHPSGQPAARLAFPPLDDFVKRASTLIRALHHAIGGKKRTPAALCEAVRARLS